MKVGLVSQFIKKASAGMGSYIRNLIHEYRMIDEIKFCCYANTIDMNPFRRWVWENISLMREINKEKIDILHVLSFAGPYENKKFIKITTVHDLIGMAYSQNHKIYSRSRYYWGAWLPFCVKNSALIIADSQNTKKDILRFLHVPEKRIRVVYLAVHESFKPIKIDDTHQEILRKYGIRTKYILSVNTIEPRKNIFNLIVAFSEYLQNSKRNDLSLVIVGKKAWDYQRCYEKVKELYLEQNVIFCGYVAQEDLPIIYNGAEAFIYPSFYEGFGFPVLEAMSCGTPVLCSQTSSLPEVCGDAALFIDPYDMRNMSFSIRKVLKDKTL